MTFPEQLIQAEWFTAHYPDWALTYRTSYQNGFYFLYHKDRPSVGVIWYADTEECRLERVKISDIPIGIVDHIKQIGLKVYDPEVIIMDETNRLDNFTRYRVK